MRELTVNGQFQLLLGGVHLAQWTDQPTTYNFTNPNWVISAFVYAYAVVAFKQELRDEAILMHCGRLPTKTNLSRLGKRLHQNGNQPRSFSPG